MFDLSYYQRGQIVVASLAGASVIETSQLLDISRGTVFVMGVCTQPSNTSSAKQNRGRKEKFSERDRRVLKQIVVLKANNCSKNDHRVQSVPEFSSATQ
ncbi:hypothetical protein TNCV_2296541 [Trichonephila clavipes]|nr:hypothetical protein TNCV_2296541 [Trichonephila clavipes]